MPKNRIQYAPAQINPELKYSVSVFMFALDGRYKIESFPLPGSIMADYRLSGLLCGIPAYSYEREFETPMPGAPAFWYNAPQYGFSSLVNQRYVLEYSGWQRGLASSLGLSGLSVESIRPIDTIQEHAPYVVSYLLSGFADRGWSYFAVEMLGYTA